MSASHLHQAFCCTSYLSCRSLQKAAGGGTLATLIMVSSVPTMLYLPLLRSEASAWVVVCPKIEGSTHSMESRQSQPGPSHSRVPACSRGVFLGQTVQSFRDKSAPGGGRGSHMITELKLERHRKQAGTLLGFSSASVSLLFLSFLFQLYSLGPVI